MNESTAYIKSRSGTITVSWTDEGITELLLPGSATKEAQEKGAPPRGDKIPASVRQAVQKVVTHIEGDPQDFRDIALDLARCPKFHQKVYRKLRNLPAGKTITYGELAKLVGSPGAARAVGQAMADNPIPIIIPCHRVVRSDGTIGNYSALSGTESKIQLLECEGVPFQRTGSRVKLEK